MIDVQLPVREAYYSLLNGSLNYNGTNVPVSDDLKKLQDTNANLYVLLSNQNGTNQDSMQSWDSQEDIVLDITYKATRSSKQPCDLIASQICNLVLPHPGIDALPRQTGTQINCVRLLSSSYITLKLNQTLTSTRKLLTFRQRVRQTLDNIVMPGLIKIFPVRSVDFLDSITYANPDLKGRTFELFFNSAGRFIKFEIEWGYRPDGGFVINIPEFNANLNIYEFYVLLK